MTRRDMIIRAVAYAVLLVCVTAVNYYFLSPLPIPLPVLLPVTAVAVGTLEGAPFGAVYGCAAGLVMAGVGHVSLLTGLVLAAAGWLSGLTAQYVLRRDLWGHMICTLVLLCCWELWQVGTRLLAGAAELPVLAGVAAPELACSVVLAVPVYWAGRFCCVHFGRIYHE